MTPPISAGILPGITRELVLAAADKLGIAQRNQCPTIAELTQSDEVFITSSVREMLAVVKVDQVPVGGGRPGTMYRDLWQAYRHLADERLAAQPRYFTG
jgi:branched-subunit amino acid aminotransferase/4-amino-4-deoxychorismate lyase